MTAGYTSSMNDVEADEGSALERNAELERLRRLAFGRTTTDAEVAAAATARLRLGAIEAEAAARALALEERERADREAFQRARAEDEARQAHPLAALDTDDPVTVPAPRRRSWLLPAAAGLLVGALVAGGAAWALAPGPSEPVTATSEPAQGGLNYFLGDEPADDTADDEKVPPGDVDAAWRWFEREQTAEDLVGVPELRPEFDSGSVRLVHSSDNARVWVTMQTDGKLCLETTEITTQVTNGSCMGTDDFAVEALRVESNELTAVWTGTELSVVLSPR